MTSTGAEKPVIRKLSAQRKLLTVMFVDIVASSSLVAGRDPEDADLILRTILAPITDAVHRYGGTVAQMLGDGVMAVFGAPVALEDHGLRACLAAQDIIGKEAITLADGTAVAFSVRVGIASGEVVAQVIENGVWSDYRTVGEAVHLAAKLQQRAAPNQILLSRESVELVPVGLRVQPAGTFSLSDGAAPAPVFALQAVRAGRRTAMDLLSSRPDPFVGRQRELFTLTASLGTAGNGQGSVTLIVGEAGIGKSRLVSEVLRTPDVARRHVLQWPQLPIRPMGEPDGLERVARGLTSLTEGQSEESSRGWLCAVAARDAGALAAAALGDLLGMAATDPVWDGVPAAERLTLAIDGLVAVLVALSRARPLVILVEDAHWVSADTARLLDTLTPVTAQTAIHIVATSRPEAGAWTPRPETRRIKLDALPDTEVQEYLRRALGTDPSLSELKAMVTARGQGMPLYLIESLRALIGSGAIIGSSGRFRRSDRGGRIELPPSVRDLLASRIEALPHALQDTLVNAAVIGPIVDVELLRELGEEHQASTPQVIEALTDLEEAGFVHRTRLIPNLEYSFRHALVQEVAYGSLTRPKRLALHTRLVQALRRRHDHDLPGRLDLLAHHAFLAENWRLAFAYGRHAGLRAESRSKLDDASRCYTNTLTALEHLEPTRRNIVRRIDLSIALTRAMLPRGVRQGHDHLRRAGDLATQVGDAVRIARAASVHASYLWSHGDLDEAIHLSRIGLAALKERDCRETRIQLLTRMAGFMGEQGLFCEARDALLQAKSMIDPARPYDHYGMAIAASVAVRALLGRTLAELGETGGALRVAEDAYAMAEDSGHIFSKVVAGVHFGWTLLVLNHPRQAMPVLQDTLAICNAIRSPLHIPKVMGGVGYAHTLLGEPEKGLPLLARSLEIYHSNGLRLYTRQVHLWQAQALLHAGQPDAALAEARAALAASQEARQEGYQAWATWISADACLALGRGADTIRRQAATAMQQADRMGMALLSGLCARTLSRLAPNRGEADRLPAFAPALITTPPSGLSAQGSSAARK